MTENSTTARIDVSYSKPIAALPKNHGIPYPGSNKPKAVLRLCGGITPVSIAGNSEPCALIPTPQKIIRINQKTEVPRKTNGAAAAETKNGNNDRFGPNQPTN